MTGEEKGWLGKTNKKNKQKPPLKSIHNPQVSNNYHSSTQKSHPCFKKAINNAQAAGQETDYTGKERTYNSCPLKFVKFDEKWE